ncbi:MAG: polysaccharide pyruvyl transferase family protein [Lachnospiraceae bacterium]
MRIGIMGAPAENANLGCMALAYSMIFCLNEIEKELNDDFKYVIFDWKYNQESFDMMARELDIDRAKIQFAPYTFSQDWIRGIYHLGAYCKMKKEIKKCDVVFDITGGDSFSDIYGDMRHKGRTSVKLLVEKLGVPLILAPQTYGPYFKDESRKIAVDVIDRARYVMARDLQSQEWVKANTDKDAIYTPDMAFMLPYHKQDKTQTEKIRLGINASSILYTTSEITDRKFEISVDYVKYMKMLLKKLIDTGKYDIYMIPHVSTDHSIHEILKKEFPEINVVQPIKNPIEAKTLISTMDIFVGARMHGTIAAFTSGVACIPTSYSPKFSTLFRSVGYDVDVDLAHSTTEEAIDDTMNYVENYKQLILQIEECKNNNKDMMQKPKYEMLKCIRIVQGI